MPVRRRKVERHTTSTRDRVSPISKPWTIDDIFIAVDGGGLIHSFVISFDHSIVDLLSPCMHVVLADEVTTAPQHLMGAWLLRFFVYY